jgi:dynein heavy chain
VAACSKYVAAALGREFVEPAPWTLEDVFPDTSCRVPTAFILSPGVRRGSCTLHLAG